MLDFWLIFTLGFLGSFGHCVVMCGPLTVAFALSQQRQETSPWLSSLAFHFLLNLGRILSYGLVGAALGGVSQVLINGSQWAGIGSQLRQGIAIFTGLLLIWFGLRQIKPDFLPILPLLHPLQGKLHQRLSSGMLKVSQQSAWWTPVVLGLCWGLIPCGFLYAAQLKAIETQNSWLGAVMMVGFGLGTMPMMLGVGVSASRLSASRRSQLFRLGGWVTLTIGVLTLLRTDAMVDVTGHVSLILLMLALIARPISGLWAKPLQYRRAIGVGAFVCAIAHTSHTIEHSLNWDFGTFAFMLPWHQVGIVMGTIALVLMIPAACTSFDLAQQRLGKRWRRLHLLSVPALVLAVIHAIAIGSSYLGQLQWDWQSLGRSLFLLLLLLGVLLLRSRWLWSLLSWKKVSSTGK